MIISLWAIWHAKRKALHENIFQSPSATHHFIENYMTELQALEKSSVPIQRGAADVQNKWLPPHAGHAKINVDGAFAWAGNRRAVAAICRSASGEYLGVSALVVSDIQGPACLESLACREGLALAQDLNISRVDIASDCASVVQDINKGSLMLLSSEK